MKLIVKVALAALAAAVLSVVAMWVVGLGPFNTRPSPAAKVQVQTTKAVTKTGAEAASAAASAQARTKAANTATEQRTERHVEKVRAATARAAPAAVPDREFYLGVCESKLYAGSPDCRGFGGEPEGRRPPARAGAVRGS